MNLVKCRLHWPFAILSFAVAMTASLTVVKNIERKSLVELTSANLTSTLNEWEHDSAILFYAPWCQYCKQLMPSWETIAELSTDNHNLIVSKFDCEGSDISASLCKKLKVDRYPSLYFIGYGSFNQGPGGQMIGSSVNPRIVQYVSDIYPEAVYDWVYMMAFLSRVNRRWDDVSAFFSGRSSSKEKLASYKKRTIEAERKATLFGKELQKYKANEIFDSLEDRGDPFPLLNSLEPDKVCSSLIYSFDYCIVLTLMN